jgi:hypothetical protein
VVVYFIVNNVFCKYVMVFVSGSESVHIFRCLFMIADGDPIIKMGGLESH